jgi:hypothetical protein
LGGSRFLILSGHIDVERTRMMMVNWITPKLPPMSRNAVYRMGAIGGGFFGNPDPRPQQLTRVRSW